MGDKVFERAVDFSFGISALKGQTLAVHIRFGGINRLTQFLHVTGLEAVVEIFIL